MGRTSHAIRNKQNLTTLDYTELIDILKAGGVLNYDVIKAWYLKQKEIQKQQANNISGLTYNTILALSESCGLPIYECSPNTYKLLTPEVMKQYEKQTADYWNEMNKKIRKYRMV